ncbi:hypothetical protein FK529_08850 [Tsukamurella asaccharolytica]|uniref:Uncharacterized protein n=1 Tax=Tsukamurella asaccharolytica TaxID=2592067 RepID=A0A5C5RCS6_9ACTN|nr:hypothetical protein [Tsukamurella asaccharolytica]TWS20213.1 hypothetical protein FK529_08850 [Tsukamurella asaccharolytica]
MWEKLARVAELVLYLLGAAALVIWLLKLGEVLDNGLDALGVLSLGITALGAGLAVTIYQAQKRQGERENRRQRTLLDAISRRTTESAVLLQEMQGAFAASQAPGPDEARDGNEQDSAVDDLEVDDADSTGIIEIEEQGEYRLPSAVPLKVLADVVNWWRDGNASGSWTVGNLVGSFRPYNKSGGLQGVPWILTFRRTSGDPAEYRVSYSGRKKAGESTRKPTVSLYSAQDQRWTDGRPAGSEIDIAAKGNEPGVEG